MAATEDLARRCHSTRSSRSSSIRATHKAPPAKGQRSSRPIRSRRRAPSPRCNSSDKVGSGAPPVGNNTTIAPLDRVRADSAARALTTNQGVPVGDNQNSLKAGLARPDAARRLHPAREDHALRSRAHSRAHRPCARLGRARLLRVLQAARKSSRARRSLPRPASGRRCSSASRPWSASAARPTPRATCAASR